ncbi:MAG: hypothetical protein CMA64_09705 [Euryarchaeota archaeon]|jgi:hypothetical protein|nr:hypothetical protein [Euryarchaeota archaeon]
MLYGYSTSKNHTQVVVDAFIKGSNGVSIDISDLKNGLPGDASTVTSFGFLRGTAEVFRQAESKGINYLHIDHAYFQGGHKTGPDPWYRITKNGLNIKEINKKWPADRFNFYFSKQLDIQPWKKKDNGYILILPPTQPTAWYTNSTDWLDNTVQLIKSKTDRAIKIRYKPPVIACDDKGYPLPPDVVKQQIQAMEHLVSSNTLQQDLDGAYCVVAYNSGVVVDAIAQGIPVISHSNAASHSLSFRFGDIDKNIMKEEPDRQNWFNALAYHQYRLSEMKDGTAWNLLKEHHGI